MKNTLMKSTLILVIGGAITKILSMVIKIVLSRLLTTYGVGIYYLILPTFSLLISLTSLGLPMAISKLVSEGGRNNKRLLFSLIPVTLGFDLLVIIILILSSDFIANNLLHNINYKYIIIAMGLVLPFIDLSSIIRGYFFGKERMIPHVISNITEDFVRLILLIIGIPYFIKKGIYNAIIYVILVNIVSELISILVLYLFLPKNFVINKKDLKINYKDVSDTFKIGIPSTVSRLIGNIGYFLEPIIITTILLKIGYNNNFITLEYGIINGYVMPILLLPSFFTLAISSALLPIISKNYKLKNYKYVSKKIKQAIIYSLIIGIPFTILIIIFPHIPLKLLYHTTDGVKYIRLLAPICILHYIQAPLTSSMQAMNKSFDAMLGTLLGIIFKILALIIFSYMHIGLYSLIIATSINIIIVTLHHIVKIHKYINPS